MNIFKLITEIERVDPEVYERLDQRRHMFRHFAGFGKKLAAAAVPLAMGSMFNKAYGQGSGLPAQVVEVLNFALTLEYLEYYFYEMGVNAPGLRAELTGQDRIDITTIRNDERAHVAFLRSVLGSAAIPDPGAAAFDYTGKGNFPDVFDNPRTFLAVAQAFEDTGVRAYKGQAPNLVGYNAVLEAALNIHSVEARHASHIRTMRRFGPEYEPADLNSRPKSWIARNDNGGPKPPVTEAVYAGEDNVMQAGVNVTVFNVSGTEGAEAFDEPLTKAAVLAIASNFIK